MFFLVCLKFEKKTTSGEYVKQKKINTLKNNLIYARARKMTHASIDLFLAYSTGLIAFLLLVCFQSPPVLLAAEKTKSPAASLNSPKLSDRLDAVEKMKSKQSNVSPEQIRLSRTTEESGLVRHRLNQALVGKLLSGVELDLIDSLKNDPDPVVRQGAAQSLGNYVQNSLVIRALSDQLKTETEKSVRYACVLSIGLSSSFLSMKALEKASVDSDPNMRRQVAFILKRHTGFKPEQLLKKLQRDVDLSVRQMAGAPR